MTTVAITTAGASAASVNEVNTKPASVMSFTSVELAMQKIACFVVVSSELMRAAGVGPTALLSRELRLALAVTTDSYFISQLTTGLTAIPSSGGINALAVRQDLRVLMDAVSFGSNARLYYIAPPQICKRLSVLGDSAGARVFPDATPVGGQIDNVPLLCSDAATASSLLLFDATQVSVSAGEITLDRSNVASLQLDNVGDSPPTASTVYQNMWQANQSALRAERFLSAQRLRTTAAASISGITGIGNSPS
jgi:HK97 family phage major capsid protein